jgi:hypothetical protein
LFRNPEEVGRARRGLLGNARAGGSALWLYAPSRERADRLAGMLADYSSVSLRYYGPEEG